MIFRLQLTYDEIIDILDVEFITGSAKGQTLAPGIYKKMLKSLLAKDVKINNTIDDIRLKSNLTTNETIRFTKNYFIYTKLDFTESHSGVLGDFQNFVQLIPGSYKGDKPIKI